MMMQGRRLISPVRDLRLRKLSFLYFFFWINFQPLANAGGFSFMQQDFTRRGSGGFKQSGKGAKPQRRFRTTKAQRRKGAQRTLFVFSSRLCAFVVQCFPIRATGVPGNTLRRFKQAFFNASRTPRCPLAQIFSIQIPYRVMVNFKRFKKARTVCNR